MKVGFVSDKGSALAGAAVVGCGAALSGRMVYTERRIDTRHVAGFAGIHVGHAVSHHQDVQRDAGRV